MTIAAFERVRMMEMLETIHEPSTYFLDRYFSDTETFDTTSVEFDIVQHKRKLAPFTSPAHEGHLIEHPGETKRTITPPYVKPKHVYEPKDMIRRMPGQSIESAARANDRLAEDTAHLQTAITRREEHMAARQLQDGSLTIVGDGYNGSIDFMFADDHKVTLSGAGLWSDADSNPIEDIRQWRRKINQDSGLSASVVTLGSDAAVAFMEHPKVQAYMDKLRMSFGEVNVGAEINGVTPIASLFGGSVVVEEYSELFYDEVTEANVELMDADRVVMGAPRARCKRLYGAIQDLDAAANGLLEAKWFPKSWVKKDPSVGFLMVQSAPLPAVLEPNGFMTIDVL